MRKSRLYLVVGMVLLVLMVAVGGSTAAPRATVTVTLASNTNTTLGFDTLIANFHKAYPSIRISPTYYDINTYQNIVPTQFAAGNAADLVWMPASAGAHSVQSLAKAGRLVNMAGRKWQSRIVKSALANVSIGKRIYAWPMGWTPYTLAYNKDAFRELGLTPPRTYSALLAFCRKAKAAGRIPLAVGVGTITDVTILAQQISPSALLAADPDWTAKRRANKVTFSNSPGWRRTFELTMQVNEKCLEPGAAGTTRNQAYSLFTSGRALMAAVPSTSIGGLLQPAAPNMNIGVTPFPGETLARTRAVGIAANTIGVNSASRNKNAALTFVDFIAREGQSQLAARTLSQISPLDVKRGNLPAPFAENYSQLYKAGRVVISPHTGWSAEVFLKFNTEGQGLFTGQRTITQVLAALDATWAEYP